MKTSIIYYGIILAILTGATTATAQPINLREVCKLDDKASETSALEFTDGIFWTLNDSGGEAALYPFDTTGVINRKLRIGGASNTDWEDLAQDDSGNVYIGDFGNNDNYRRDLRIYKIPNPSLISADIVNAEKISFAYSDQTEFPPSDKFLDFDMEAMIWFKGALYLFSKNRTDPFDGMVHVYKLPDAPGRYTAALIDSFYTGPGTMYENWITSADISPDGTKLILLSQSKAFLFMNFPGDSFFAGEKRTLEFSFISQKEAVCFVNNREVYITDELLLNVIGQKLYYMNLDEVLSTDTPPAPEGFLFEAFPNPCRDVCELRYQTSPRSGKRTLSVYSSAGKCIHSIEACSSYGSTRLALPSAGWYLAVLTENEQAVGMLRLVKE